MADDDGQKCPKCGKASLHFSKKHDAWVCLARDCGWQDRHK